MIVNFPVFGKIQKGLPTFTYDGTYEEHPASYYGLSGDYTVVAFLTSGTLRMSKAVNLDVFMVGGGGGGGKSVGRTWAAGGGAGGHVLTAKYSALANTPITVTIGAGGASGVSGGQTLFDNLSVDGGTTATNSGTVGGSGGSGGGGGGYGNAASVTNYGGAGGSNGANGANGGSYAGGTGAGITTGAFGDENAVKFSGGGGGGSSGYSPGAGGGNGNSGGSTGQNGNNALPNTGDGGGGSGDSNGTAFGGSGGSGIILMRAEI